ncbi:MAG: hypothetical protein KC731_23755 [Myxococcales bacterium]|nr:hypothetical protein [Myxococcales bacterium]
MMNKLVQGALVLASLGGLLGCEEQPDPYFIDGTSIGEVTFTPTDTSMGIHPSQAVLLDENNPFRKLEISLDGKFQIEANGSNAAAFYGWATVLARQPTGEHQFFAAVNLAQMVQNREVENRSLETVRLMAIRAFQSVLDNFPDSVTFDETGTISFPLAPGAYFAIVDLGGTPTGGWVVVETPDGIPTVVKVD